MKQIYVLILAVLLFTSLNAFEEGTINPGGTAYLSSIKQSSDSDPVLYLVATPQLGYFIFENVAVDIIPSLASYSQSGNSSGTSYTNSGTELGMGLGGRIFYNGFYGGASFSYNYGFYDSKWGSNRNKDKESALYLIPKLGMVMPITKNVHGDLGISYKMGIGKVKTTENDNGTVYKDSYDNEYRNLLFFAGLQIFFSLK